jgi:transposase
MRQTHYIAWDVHSISCEGGYVDSRGQEKGSWSKPTSIPALVEAIESVPRPRKMVIEEGPLSDYLCRNLREHVDEMVSSDPHRNALIAKEGDKDDGIDWRKLVHLYRSGMVRAVHHPQEFSRSVFKQHVQLYHERVRHRVREALKVVWRVRRLGVTVKEKDLSDEQRRSAMIEALPQEEVVLEDVKLMLEGYDKACEQVKQLKVRLIALGKAEPMVKKFCEVPGVGWVRAATFFTIVDTPFRFKSKEKLWKYAGIGLERRQSGSGPVVLRVPGRCNRELKNVLLGAAKSAAASKGNVFADQHERWLDGKCSTRIARRNTARSLATVMWGMWKSGSAFDPNLVARTAACVS